MRTLALIVSLGLSFALGAPAAALADTVQLRPDAPDRHVVVKGDTLWDISAKFLKSPWLWPELWQGNRDHIKNPHLIYPGDVVFLIMTPDGPRLSRLEAVKLGPSIHSEMIAAKDAIPTIPYDSIRPFLRRPLLDNAEALAKAPKLIGTEDSRNLISLGDRVYAVGIAGDTMKWSIVRLGKSLKSPATGEELAREVEYVGEAKILANGSPATLEIVGAEREVMLGDHLVPTVEAEQIDFLPRAPDKPVAGQIISAFGGSQASGRHATVIIDKGRADGIEPGYVLEAFHPGKTLGRVEGEGRFDSYSPKSGYLDSAKERGLSSPLDVFNGDVVPTPDPKREAAATGSTQLPDVRVGLIMVYQVFDKVSYALVMESTSPLFLLDTVVNP